MKFRFSSQDMLVWTFQMTFPNHRRLTDIRISRAIIEGVIVMPQFNAVDRSTSMYTVGVKGPVQVQFSGIQEVRTGPSNILIIAHTLASEVLNNYR